MAGKHFWKSGWFPGQAAAIAVFPPSATDRVGSLGQTVCDRGEHRSIPFDADGDVVPAARAADCVHLYSFMRRAIRPADIMQPHSDRVKVTDFGIADSGQTVPASL